MINRKIKSIALGIAIGSVSLTGFAADQVGIDQPDMVPQQDRLNQGGQRGSQLMSAEERTEFRHRMHAAQNTEERQNVQTEKRALMQERAAAQGVTLPDSPPMGGMRGQIFDRGANPGMGGMSGMGGGPGR